jgi:phage repressor protein C with HTH and peptisase S24 domain
MSMDELENVGIGRRLAKAIGTTSINDAADVAGCSPNSFRRWLKGEVSADARGLAKIAHHFHVSLMELITGMTDESGDELTVLRNVGYVPVPVTDISASAGPGMTAIDAEADFHIGFNIEWLRRMVSQPDAARILTIKGDSMEPDLRSGDEVMIDLNDNVDRARDGIYVFRLNDQLLVKRLRMLGSQAVELISANPAYPPIGIEIGGDDFKIVGRVVWSSRVMS